MLKHKTETEIGTREVIFSIFISIVIFYTSVGWVLKIFQHLALHLNLRQQKIEFSTLFPN